MFFSKTKLEGLYLITPKLLKDDRGFFARTFCANEFKLAGLGFDIVETDLSYNKKKGIIRGLHFQKVPKAQGKIVQCLRGALYDVAVDLRPDSKTFGQWFAAELSHENKTMFLIPKGFAHGFQTLEDDTEIQYFMSDFFSPEHAWGVRWDDPELDIRWPLAPTLMSEKDKNWPLLKGEEKI